MYAIRSYYAAKRIMRFTLQPGGNHQKTGTLLIRFDIRRRTDVAQIKGSVDKFPYGVTVVISGRKTDLPPRPLRITSYNVCYTKLLRCVMESSICVAVITGLAAALAFRNNFV